MREIVEMKKKAPVTKAIAQNQPTENMSNKDCKIAQLSDKDISAELGQQGKDNSEEQAFTTQDSSLKSQKSISV